MSEMSEIIEQLKILKTEKLYWITTEQSQKDILSGYVMKKLSSEQTRVMTVLEPSQIDLDSIKILPN